MLDEIEKLCKLRKGETRNFVEMHWQIEILNSAWIVARKSKNPNFSVFRGTNSKSDLAFIDFWISQQKFKMRFRFNLNWQLTKIFSQFRISICISTSISILIFSGTGCSAGSRKDFMLGNCKPKSANPILQAPSCRFSDCFLLFWRFL